MSLSLRIITSWRERLATRKSPAKHTAHSTRPRTAAKLRTRFAGLKKNGIDHYVRFLKRIKQFRRRNVAAYILTVRQQDDRLAALYTAELFSDGLINRITKSSSKRLWYLGAFNGFDELLL